MAEGLSVSSFLLIWTVTSGAVVLFLVGCMRSLSRGESPIDNGKPQND